MTRIPSIPFPPAYGSSRVAPDTMISIASFVTLALAGMVVATPFKRAPAVSLSGRDSDPAEDKNVVDCPDNTQIPFVVDA